MPTLLLTGATGFLGQACRARLERRGYRVHTVARRPAPGVFHHRVDLLDRAAVSDLLERVRPTHLVHLAWIATPGVYWTSPANDPWAAASLHLAEEFIRYGGHRAVFAGTCAEYDWQSGVCREDETPLTPTSAYGRAKHALHQAVAELHRSYGLSYAWARLFFLYGPGEPQGRLIPSVVRALLQGESPACSEGTQRRDFIHVDDAAEALAGLLGAGCDGPVNVGTGEAVAVREVVTYLATALGGLDRVRWGARPGDAEVPLVVADPTRLRHRVGFWPKYDWRSGLAHVLAGWRSHHAKAA